MLESIVSVWIPILSAIFAISAFIGMFVFLYVVGRKVRREQKTIWQIIESNKKLKTIVTVLIIIAFIWVILGFVVFLIRQQQAANVWDDVKARSQQTPTTTPLGYSPPTTTALTATESSTSSLPLGIPVYPKASLIKKSDKFATFESFDPIPQVADFYQTQLSKLGFTVTRKESSKDFPASPPTFPKPFTLTQVRLEAQKGANQVRVDVQNYGPTSNTAIIIQYLK